MEYQQEIEDHLILLDAEETDRFFGAWNPDDPDVPAYLIRAGHRFIKAETYEWLITHVGDPHVAWSHEFGMFGTTRNFRFRSKVHATLFKLTFS